LPATADSRVLYVFVDVFESCRVFSPTDCILHLSSLRGNTDPHSLQTQISVPDDTNSISFALKTYLTSLSMQENGWYAWVNETNGRPHLGGGLCNKHSNNILDCNLDTIWASPQSGRRYYLRQKGKNKSTGVALIDQIAGFGWADLPTLLDGAYNCTASVSPPFRPIIPSPWLGRSKMQDARFCSACVSCEVVSFSTHENR